MAQAIAFQSGSPLIGSPLTYRVTPSAHLSQYTFHRVMLRVVAALETDTDYTQFDLSTPVQSATPVDFDISSALRAVADRYEYPATPPQRYPYVKFRLEAWDEWMIDGVLYDNRDPKQYPGMGQYLFAFMGAFTDLERLTAQQDGIGLSHWTRKPFASSPEVVHTGRTFILPTDFEAGIGNVNYVGDGTTGFPPTPTQGPKSTAYVVGTDQIPSGLVYAIDPTEDSYELRFINGFGCEETVHVTCLRQSEVTVQTQKYAIARQETFRQFSRSMAVKQNNREQWKMTSGPVDKAWQQWYVHEFLMAETAWIKLNGNLLPINILPDDTVKTIDRTKADLLSVEFTIEFDMNGSPW